MSFILKINNLFNFFFAIIFSGKLVLANQTVFENYDSFRNSKEYLSEFVITDEKNIKWKNFFSNKSFKEIELFLQTMPINTSDKMIQEIIFEILVSKKTFDRNLINDDDDKILFEIFINKLFDTGRLNEIELVYSQTSELESNSFILKKMIEGNLLRNRHSEACKILQKVNQDPTIFGKIMIICNIINNKFDQAKLGLQLLKEQNQPGDIFFIDLAFSLMSDKDISESSDLKKNLDQVKELNPIIMSSLQFADISPNFEQIEKLSTSGLLFVLSNPSVDTELKIFCSEMLVKQGRISADMLSEAYQLSSFDEKEIQKAESLYKSLSPVRARPLLYQSIIRDNKPESKFRKIIALIKISMNDNLLPEISFLVGDLLDFEKYVRNHEDTILISKMFQSRKKFIEARSILNKFYDSPKSDVRNLAIDISEFLLTNKLDYYSFEKQLEKVTDSKSIESTFTKKVLMLLIDELDLNQNLLDKLLNTKISTSIKSNDIKNFFLASKLSDEKDFFNSLSLLFKIVDNKNLTKLNLIETYSVLTILKNLGLENEYKKLASRILLYKCK
ncbi:MAG: hypothetical protein CM15mP40_03580 [Alphaproteobacteria bacterium]|nr:MAG: hypothetical protein CM15mP40_03580 [Alphaproteobacteria bacterium]